MEVKMFIKRNGEVYKVVFDDCTEKVKVDFSIVGNIITKLYILDSNLEVKSAILTLDLEKSPLGIIKAILGVYNIVLIKQSNSESIKANTLFHLRDVEELELELSDLRKDVEYLKRNILFK